jgi:hypothetical protein
MTAPLSSLCVYALLSYDDLPGTDQVLYAGGDFTRAGGVLAPAIAKWDGSSWSPVGMGIPGIVVALASFDDGSGRALYAGGAFQTIAGIWEGDNIAMWNGTDWHAVGSPINGTNGPVHALAVFDDGRGPALYVGGDFSQAGGQPADSIARWNGQSWSGVGGGVGEIDPEVWAFQTEPNESIRALYVAGKFSSAGDQEAHDIAVWDCTPSGGCGAGIGCGALGVSWMFYPFGLAALKARRRCHR